jgi:hypothetical protein
MAKISGNSIQLGDSATATNNFVLQTALDGTAKLSRGNVGATTQDVLTVGADGVVVLTNNLIPCFGVYQSSAQTIPTSVTKINFQTKEFDTTTAFNTTTMRFTPLVAGYYQVNGAITTNSTGVSYVAIYKKGILYKTGNYVPLNNSGTVATVSSLVYLNGSTDYIELFGLNNSGTTLTATISATYFNGVLVRVA